MTQLDDLGASLGALLKERRQTVAVADGTEASGGIWRGALWPTVDVQLRINVYVIRKFSRKCT